MIVCLGTTPTIQRTMVFETIAIDGVNRTSTVRDYASGKSINVAKVAAQLGESTRACGIAGGTRGEFLKEDLSRRGIAHNLLPVAAQTRLCLTMIDHAGGTATEYIEEALPLTSMECSALIDALPRLLNGADVVVLSGSIAWGLGDDFYARCVRIAQSQGAKTIVDATGTALKFAMAEHPTLIKPNIGELAFTLGTTLSTEAQVRDAAMLLAHQTGSAIVVSAGKAPVVVCDGKTSWRLTLPFLRPVSAVGSGDSMAAGLAVGMLRKLDLPETVALGAACGMANALTPYAGEIAISDMKKIIPTIKIERL